MDPGKHSSWSERSSDNFSYSLRHMSEDHDHMLPGDYLIKTANNKFRIVPCVAMVGLNFGPAGQNKYYVFPRTLRTMNQISLVPGQ